MPPKTPWSRLNNVKAIKQQALMATCKDLPCPNQECMTGEAGDAFLISLSKTKHCDEGQKGMAEDWYIDKFHEEHKEWAVNG